MNVHSINVLFLIAPRILHIQDWRKSCSKFSLHLVKNTLDLIDEIVALKKFDQDYSKTTMHMGCAYVCHSVVSYSPKG